MDKIQAQFKNLTDPQRKKLLAAAEIVQNGDMAVLKKIIEFEDVVEESKEKVDSGMEEVKSTLKTLSKQVETKLSEVKDGETPTTDELLELITPLIPEPIHGKSPTKQELVALIEPLIPKITVPEPQEAPEVNTEEIVNEVLKKIPENKVFELEGEDVVDKLNALPTNPENQIDASHIKNLPIGKNGYSPTVIGNAVDLNQSARANGYAVVWDETNKNFKFAASSVGAVGWGDITGTLSAQTDLQSALDAKGTGDVSKVGTPVNNQIGVWTGDGTLEGTSDFTYDGTSLNLVTGKNFQIAGGTVLADSAGTLILSGIDSIDATTEATIEAAIDTLANLTSIQGRTVTLADAGADALLGWDDSASAYQNLSAADAKTALSLNNVDNTSDATKNAATATLTNKTIQAGIIDYVIEPASDDTYEGESTNDLNAGDTIAQWDLVYLDSTSGRWEFADADAVGTAGSVLLALATASGTDGNPMNVIFRGVVRNDGWTWSGVGKVLYASTTPGGMTETAPSGTDDVIRVVGYTLSDDAIYFNPSMDWITST